jgi:hypothetical protein
VTTSAEAYLTYQGGMVSGGICVEECFKEVDGDGVGVGSQGAKPIFRWKMGAIKMSEERKCGIK